MMIRQAIFDKLLRRIAEKRRFMQVLIGPRQVGKTTLAVQALHATTLPNHYASADEPGTRDTQWLEQQWEVGRLKAGENRAGALLALDEIQKIPHWPGTVKRLWDADSRAGLPLKVLLLGSAPLLMQTGLTESLAGRFEVIPVPHWSFAEMREAFSWTLDDYIFYGGYPGAADLIGEPERWRRYLRDSLIETTISRDILLLTRVDKPALLRQVFELSCAYSGQILSYQKMVGQLSDAGNTTTLAHYLQLLGGAGMVTGIGKYSSGVIRQRASSPKLLALNTGLISAMNTKSIEQAKQDGHFWGRMVESSVGAHLLNSSLGENIEITYWREGNCEVDFVLRQGQTTVAIEVKSQSRRNALSGMEIFKRQFKPKRILLVGAQGIPLEDFLTRPASYYLH